MERAKRLDLILDQLLYLVLKDTTNITDFELGKLGNQIFILPSRKIGINKLPVLSVGVLLGEFDKGVFRPYHNFFMAYGREYNNAVRLTSQDDRVYRFLKGEQITCEDVADGWCVILADGYPIGFGKAKNGVVNNHYPKGLRIIQCIQKVWIDYLFTLFILYYIILTFVSLY